MKQKPIAIIPARYMSQRLPGKPLTKIAGKTLIERTWQNAKQSALFSHIIVATDDQRVFDHVLTFGGEAQLTSLSCPTGTDRIIEVLENSPSLLNTDCIVNLQGDEPSIEPEVLQAVITGLRSNKEAVCATACVPLANEEELRDPHLVKCVIDQQGFALYFSRGLIPYGKYGEVSPSESYYHHLGLYAYRPDFLLKWKTLAMTPLQKAEDLEQLKILEHGYKIHLSVVESKSFGIDTEEDIKRIERRL